MPTDQWCLKGFCVGLTILASSAWADGDGSVVFSDQQTKDCVAEVEASTPALDDWGVLNCAGRSAQACMMAPGGDTTVGMIDCLQLETEYWEQQMNEALAERLAAAAREDAGMTSIRASVMSLEKTLQASQEAWVAYRQAHCLHEQAQWVGGTGGGPATAACYLHEAARRTLKLSGWWAQ